MENFNVQMRQELESDYRVFYVTAWGYAADHLLGWFPKALNCHHDMFALLAHEGSRPKYLVERTRGERPPLVIFTEFLNDMGMTYSVIGDCYSYRAGQMSELLNIERYKNIPVLNIVRHPVTWLEYYVRWRSSNMRMREGATDPLAWEWKTSCHGYFEYLGLKSYEKNDIDIWASYQGMFLLNNVLGDIKALNKHFAIEKIANEPELFRELVKYLSKGKVFFDQVTLDLAYSMRDTLFSGESAVETNPEILIGGWPDWKIDAFRKLVHPETLEAYYSFGYATNEMISKAIIVKPAYNKVQRSIFVSSLPKSGTWLLREILEMITGLKAYEPDIGEKEPDYENEMLIDFPHGTIFSWHSILTSRTASLLNGCQSKNIFLIRNIYDVLLSMYNHIKHDVDAVIGRSITASNYFKDKSLEQSFTLMISGFTTAEISWMGAGPVLKQIDSMLSFAESGHALLIDYEELTLDKMNTIKRILSFLELRLPEKRINEIIIDTDKNVMRERLKSKGSELHVTNESNALSRDAFSPYHKHMVDRLIMTEVPRLPERFIKLKVGSVLSLEKVEVVPKKLTFNQKIKNIFKRNE